MSQPNDPYGQQGWPGQPGPHQQQPYPGPQPTQQYGSDTGPQPTQQYGGQQYGQPTPTGGWPQQQPDQGQYGQQQYGQPDPTMQYGQQYGTPPPGSQYPAYGPLPPQPPQRRAGRIVGSLVAVIALVAAGIATYMFAFAGSAAGAPSPREAAVNLVNALSQNDMIGLLDGLAPAEGDVAKDYLSDTLDELKRLEVVKPDTKPEQITGVEFKAEDLVFDEAAQEQVNDRLTITKLTDGKITISSDWSRVPLTDSFLRAAFPDGVPANETETYDIGDEIAADNGEPIRIATVKVDGEWYPSLFYSIADAALQSEGESWPAQPIAANGAESPDAAVRQLIDAALEADVKRVIELTPPDEMAALHDAGQLLVDAAAGEEPTGVTITDLQTKVEDVAGGKRVSLTKLVVENPDGESFSMAVNGDCITVSENGDSEEFCGKDLAEMIAEFAELGGSDLTDAQLGAIERVTIGYLHTGVVTTEVDSRWYVSPVRSIGDISTGFLRELQPGDLEALIELIR